MKPEIKSVTQKRVRGGVKAAPYELSGIDLLSTHMGIPIVWVYPNGFDLEVFEEAFSKTLAKYPTAAGRIRSEGGRTFVDPCDGGVELIVRECAGKMPAFGPKLHLDGQIKHFAAPIYPWNVVNKDTPLMRAVVSRYEDGGIVFCLTCVHSICDGTSFFRFMQEWARACHGVAPEGPTDANEVMIALGRANAERPYTRDLIYEPGVLERLALYARIGYQSLTSVRKGVYRISADRIESWKLEAKDELAAGEFVGTVDIVTAHFLRTLSPVLPSRRDRRVAYVNDLRYKKELGIPRGFFGNALAQAELAFTADEVEKGSLVAMTRRLRQAAGADDTADVLSYVGLVERYRAKRSVSKLLMRTVASTLDSGMLLNNYRPFPIYELDFGHGKPSWHDNPRLLYRALKVVSTPEMDGGVDIHLSAHKKELAVAAAVYG